MPSHITTKAFLVVEATVHQVKMYGHEVARALDRQGFRIFGVAPTDHTTFADRFVKDVVGGFLYVDVATLLGDSRLQFRYKAFDDISAGVTSQQVTEATKIVEGMALAVIREMEREAPEAHL